MTDDIDLSDIDITIDVGEGADTITLNSAYFPNSYSSISGMTVGGITSGTSITAPNTITTGTGAGTGYTFGPGTASTWASPLTAGHGIKVTGNADFDGDVTIKGQSIMTLLEKIEDRLAILMDPSPERLEKFQALKKAYDNYKLMDKLCQESPEEEEDK